jgi:hypothetical protein
MHEYPKPPFPQKEQDWPGFEAKMSVDERTRASD